jgi:hypothetical protein
VKRGDVEGGAVAAVVAAAYATRVAAVAGAELATEVSEPRRGVEHGCVGPCGPPNGGGRAGGGGSGSCEEAENTVSA